MENKSLKTNFLWNSCLRVLNIIFPIITFPYVARILLPEGIGLINFINSFIAYFLLIARLGMPLYGVRECAKVREDKDRLSHLVQELLIVNLISIAIAYFLLFITLEVSFLFKDNLILVVIMSLSIFTNSLGMEWLYSALEEYKYITIRNLIIKIISLILIFLFVKEKNDYINYVIIIVFSSTGSFLLNFYHSFKFINYRKFYEHNIKQHIKPLFFLFGMHMAISIYANLDKVMLGIITGNESVGLYVAANKLIKIIISIITSLSGVLLPRMSYYVEKGLSDRFHILIRKALNFIWMISIPAVVGIVLISKEIIIIFAGKEYIDAIVTIRILAPIIFLIGTSNLIGIQILLPLGKEKYTLISVIWGAIINFFLNIFLISKYAYNGAAIATIVAEITVTSIQIFYAKEYIFQNIKVVNVLKYIFSSIIMAIVILIFKSSLSSSFLVLLIVPLIGAFIYGLLLSFLKDEIMMEIHKDILKLIRRKNNGN